MGERAILLFDGVCNFCNGVVNWVIDRDPDARIRFASLQSETGRRLLREHGYAPDAIDTIVLIEGGDVALRSEAVIGVLRCLPRYGPLARLLSWLPRGVRDFGYDFFARNRYRWFGSRDECRVPDAGVRARFLE